jgi:hypothetical protein
LYRNLLEVLDLPHSPTRRGLTAVERLMGMVLVALAVRVNPGGTTAAIFKPSEKCQVRSSVFVSSNCGSADLHRLPPLALMLTAAGLLSHASEMKIKMPGTHL